MLLGSTEPLLKSYSEMILERYDEPPHDLIRREHEQYFACDLSETSNLGYGTFLQSTECEGVDIVPEAALCDTFLASYKKPELAQDFAFVWNELAGQSTSFSGDAPLIIANVLNLQNYGLVDLEDAAQMF